MEVLNDSLDAIITYATQRVDSLLDGVPSVFDGTRNNVWIELPHDEFSVLVSTSDYLGRGKSYHIAKHVQEDIDGYIVRHAYYWGDGMEPSLLITRTHKSRLFLSSIHHDDVRQLRPINPGDGDNIKTLLGIAEDLNDMNRRQDEN